MTRVLRLTVLATFLLGVGSLVIGSFGAKAPVKGEHSPYLSSLSDLSVRPAEAQPCNDKLCEFIDRPGTQHDEWVCTGGFEATHCFPPTPTSCNDYEICPPL